MNKDMLDMYFANHIDGKIFNSVKELFTFAIQLGVANERSHWKTRVQSMLDEVKTNYVPVEVILEQMEEWL